MNEVHCPECGNGILRAETDGSFACDGFKDPPRTDMPLVPCEHAVYPASLSGRCANGFERGTGALIHAIDYGAVRLDDYFTGPAVCGAKPGRRSSGWSIRYPGAITCRRCLKRLRAALAGEGKK